MSEDSVGVLRPLMPETLPEERVCVWSEFKGAYLNVAFVEARNFICWKSHPAQFGWFTHTRRILVEWSSLVGTKIDRDNPISKWLGEGGRAAEMQVKVGGRTTVWVL